MLVRGFAGNGIFGRPPLRQELERMPEPIWPCDHTLSRRAHYQVMRSRQTSFAGAPKIRLRILRSRHSFEASPSKSSWIFAVPAHFSTSPPKLPKQSCGQGRLIHRFRHTTFPPLQLIQPMLNSPPALRRQLNHLFATMTSGAATAPLFIPTASMLETEARPTPMNLPSAEDRATASPRAIPASIAESPGA